MNINEQKKYYKNPQIKRFFWQTNHVYLKKKEKELIATLRNIILNNNYSKILEVGCGEGANILNLNLKNEIIGIDYSKGKINFAKKQKKKKKNKFFVQDAASLNFDDNSFDLVYCRDLLHHLKEKKKAIDEMIRVAKKKVIIIENNGNNPLIWLFAAFVKIERDAKNSKKSKIMHLLRQNKRKKFNINVYYKEPFPFFRFIYHYNFGLASLANFKIFNFINNTVNFISKYVIPKFFWGYIIYEINLKEK